MHTTSCFTQLALSRQVVDKLQTAYQVLQASLHDLLSRNYYHVSENINVCSLFHFLHIY